MKKSPKPSVFSNLAVSLDGKIATSSREFFAIGSAHDLLLLRKLRDRADVVLYGAEVLRTFRKPCLPLKKEVVLTNAVLSRTLKGIDPTWPFFTSKRIKRILYVTGKVPEKRRLEFLKTSEIVAVSAENPALDILQDLHRRRMSRVAVEGGGSLMWEFVKNSLIDEYYITVVPRIIGGTRAPTLVDGVGFSPLEALNLRLKRLKRIGSELFLVYKPLSRRGLKHPLFD